MIIRNRIKAAFTVRPVWVTNGCRFAVIAMLCSSLRMLLFRLGMDWLRRSTKQGCLSFAPARIGVRPNTCFSTAAAAAAAAAACFCCGASVSAAALFVGSALCFIFYSNSSAKAIWWWMLYRTLRKVTCTNMRKNTYDVFASLAE